jgi:hypothetical protein
LAVVNAFFGCIDCKIPSLDKRLADELIEVAILAGDCNRLAAILFVVNQKPPTAPSSQKDLIFFPVDVDRVKHLADKSTKLNVFSFKPIDIHHSPPYAAPKWVGKRIGNLGQLLSTPHVAIIG